MGPPAPPAASKVLNEAPLSHQATCDCYGNGDGMVVCEAGFSNGANAAGLPFQVRDGAGNVLFAGVTGDNSDFSFQRPAVDFVVEFDGGENHVVLMPLVGRPALQRRRHAVKPRNPRLFAACNGVAVGTTIKHRNAKEAQAL